MVQFPCQDSVGGLVGGNGGTISESFATGNVYGAVYDVGGLVGDNIPGGTVTDSFASGHVSGPYRNIGGLAGENDGLISTSYSNGAVTNGYGLIGITQYAGAQTNSYWDVNSSGTTSSNGGNGLTTAQLTNGTLPNGFSRAVWGAQSGHYPCLLWQANCIAMAAPSPTVVTYAIGNSSSTYGTLAPLGAVTLTGVLASDLTNVSPVVSLFDSSNNSVTLSAALNAGTFTEKVTSLTGSAASNYTIAATGNTNGI